MTDPYNTAPPRKDPWREVPVKKDRRKSNPRRTRLRGTRARKAGLSRTYSIKGFGRNPRKLSKAAQRRQAKSLLDWAGTVLRSSNTKFPGGRMSHDVARDQIALVRQKYASNPRRPYFLLEAHRGKQRLYYAGRSKFASRKGAKLIGSKADAGALAVELRAGFPKALKGWSLRVVTA